MTRILVVEKSPLIATDIVETVCHEFPCAEAIMVTNIEDAETALEEGGVIDICIVSGSATRERLQRLANALDDRNIRTIAITDEQSKSDIFGTHTIQLWQPFTSDMLLQAVRKVSRDDPDAAPSSDQG